MSKARIMRLPPIRHRILPVLLVLLSPILVGTALWIISRSNTGPRVTYSNAAFSEYSSRDQEMFLTVLDGMFKSWQQQGATLNLPQAFFISLNDVDAPPDLLALLRKRNLTVEGASQWQEGKGVYLSLGPIHHLSADEAEMGASYQYKKAGVTSGLFHLSKRVGKWVVTKWVETDV